MAMSEPPTEPMFEMISISFGSRTKPVPKTVARLSGRPFKKTRSIEVAVPLMRLSRVISTDDTETEDTVWTAPLMVALASVAVPSNKVPVKVSTY